MTVWGINKPKSIRSDLLRFISATFLKEQSKYMYASLICTEQALKKKIRKPRFKYHLDFLLYFSLLIPTILRLISFTFPRKMPIAVPRYFIPDDNTGWMDSQSAFQNSRTLTTKPHQSMKCLTNIFHKLGDFEAN